jgi:hypothetical protein
MAKKWDDDMQDWYDDIREKSHTARSAKNRKRGGGKRGSAKLPSDYMTDKQLRAMNGEVATYRLGAPMTWAEFKEMPEDLQVIYVKKLRKLYNVPDEVLAYSMGSDISEFNERIRKLKLSPHDAAWTVDECAVFTAWWI